MRLVCFAAAAACAVVALAPTESASAAGASTRCTAAGARAAIGETKPRLALIGPKVLITPEQADRVLCFDVTRDGRTDMAVSLASGGTAGDVGWLLFVPDGSHWRLAGSGSGYKLGLFRSGGDLEIVQPVYRRNDPNCCPTGGVDHAVLRWNGHRLARVRHWHTKTF